MAGGPFTVVSNDTNLEGFPAAINQGLQLARGEYLVLLNNDVVVTDELAGSTCRIGQCLAFRTPGRGKSSVSEAAEPRLSPSFDAPDKYAAGGKPQPQPSDGPVISCAETTPQPSVGRVLSCAETTPPSPPVARGGKVSAGASSDGRGAGRTRTLALDLRHPSM